MLMLLLLEESQILFQMQDTTSNTEEEWFVPTAALAQPLKTAGIKWQAAPASEPTAPQVCALVGFTHPTHMQAALGRGMRVQCAVADLMIAVADSALDHIEPDCWMYIIQAEAEDAAAQVASSASPPWVPAPVTRSSPIPYGVACGTPAAMFEVPFAAIGPSLPPMPTINDEAEQAPQPMPCSKPTAPSAADAAAAAATNVHIVHGSAAGAAAAVDSASCGAAFAALRALAAGAAATGLPASGLAAALDGFVTVPLAEVRCYAVGPQYSWLIVAQCITVLHSRPSLLSWVTNGQAM